MIFVKYIKAKNNSKIKYLSKLILGNGVLRKNIFVLCYILFISEFINGQSLTGMTGYFNIPSANIIEDGQINVGSSFINKKYLKYTGMQKDVAALFLTFGFIPNVELSGRFTRQLKYTGSQHNIDRVASLKIRFLSESKFIPAIALGLHNPISGLEDANHFNSTYLVGTKSFYFEGTNFLFSLTVGQGFDWIKAADHQFIGTFGGLLIRYGNQVNIIEIMVENDAERWNAGIRMKLFCFLSVMGGLQGMDSFSGNVSINFSL